MSKRRSFLEFTKDNYEYTFTFNDDFVYEMLYAFDTDNIGQFIGKIINCMFLKENKEDQSMFATDTVRLNYSIKEYINENKNKWVLDKGANKVTKIIINPLLKFFIKELKLHLQKENNKMMLSGTKKLAIILILVMILSKSNIKRNLIVTLHQFFLIKALHHLKDGEHLKTRKTIMIKRNHLIMIPMIILIVILIVIKRKNLIQKMNMNLKQKKIIC